MISKSKNLLDVETEIQESIKYINKNDEHLIGAELNEKTLNYLKSKGIYSFRDVYNKDIPIIIDNSISDNQVKFHREKNINATEYEPYEIRSDN